MATSVNGRNNDTTWQYWVSEYSTSTSTTDTNIWKNWCNDSTSTSTSSAASDDKIWVAWVSDYDNTTSNGTAYVPVRVYTPEDLRQIERQNQEHNRRMAEENRKREEQARVLKDQRDKAEERAKVLLMELIGKEQLSVYEKTGRLFVKGEKNNYIIRREGRIIKFNEKEISELCFHLSNRYKYPDTDNVIAVKLAIEGQEDLFLNKANESNKRQRALVTEPLPQAACLPIN